MSKRLPDANDWKARNIDDWNTKTCHAYMQDKHREMIGREYVPFRGWRVEQGMLGRLIGIRADEGPHDKSPIKRVIDLAVEEYTATTKSPGTTFVYNSSYKRKVKQRVEAEASDKERLKERMESAKEIDYSDLSEWL